MIPEFALFLPFQHPFGEGPVLRSSCDISKYRLRPRALNGRGSQSRIAGCVRETFVLNTLCTLEMRCRGSPELWGGSPVG